MEFKKQLVSNKSLKEYFKNNPQEKEILLNDIEKAHTKYDRYLFRSLDVMPDYVIPGQMIASTPDQINACTIGTGCILPGNSAGVIQTGKNLNQKEIGGGDLIVVEDDNPSGIVQKLVGFPAAVERYKNRTTEGRFAYEDPTLTDHNALEPTSGRKLWKLRHNKRIRKPLKADKTGFIGGATA